MMGRCVLFCKYNLSQQAILYINALLTIVIITN